jgi:hypothetical protein
MGVWSDELLVVAHNGKHPVDLVTSVLSQRSLTVNKFLETSLQKENRICS